MRVCLPALAILLLAPTWVSPAVADPGKWSGNIALEGRLFAEEAAYPGQRDGQFSLSLQPEYYKAWDDGSQSFTLTPFLRLDSMDPERSHWDIREMTWLKVGEDWELRAGIRKLFWGVTESQHLVDIVNQTDLLEGVDGEEKLGQPMINLSLARDYGIFDFYLLPTFRERQFPGQHGRLRSSPRVDDEQPLYESSAKEHHVDWAARWFNTFGDWDVGLSHFSGTGRSPTFQYGTDAQGDSVLIPYYAQVDQTGLEIQATKEAWLWKLETISRRSLGDRYTAATGGFEYTFVGVMDSDADVGVIAEYLFDDRGEGGTSPLENDLMLGTRLTFNDADSTDLLLGTIVDLNRHNFSLSIEGSRRVMENWKVSVEGRAFVNTPAADPLYPYRRDSFLQIELARYF